MTWWQAALWGLAGGLCVEALELYAQIRATPKWSWRQPIEQGLAAYLISVVLRAGVGAVLAAATAASGQVTGALAALGLGVAAPLVIEKLARVVAARAIDVDLVAPPAAEPTAAAARPAVQPPQQASVEPGGGAHAS